MAMKIFVVLGSTSNTESGPADPTIIVDADGEQDTKKALKALSFPLMDDDALPSSFVQRILGAIGKWRVKMHGIMETLQAMDTEEKHESMSKLLDHHSSEMPAFFFIYIYIYLSLSLFFKLRGIDTVRIPVVIIPKLRCWLRLEKRANEIDVILAAVEAKITKVNTVGIIDGFKSESPGLTCDSFI